MSLVLGLVALALAGQAGAPSPTSEDAPISFRIRFVEMNGLDWRGALHSQLQPVARKGLATVWTARREVVGALDKHVDHVVAAPRITTVPMSDATVMHRTTRSYVGHLKRHSDGPIDHATRVAYEPEVKDIREGELATLSGRKLDQGVLTCVVLDDTFVTAVHTVRISESLEKTSAQGAHPATLVSQVQVPEVSETKVEGEWLIPNEHVLIVSLGAHTIGDAEGKAVVRERLVVIDADPPHDAATLEPLPPLPSEPAAASAEAPTTPDVITFSLAAARTVADLLASVHLASLKPMPALPSRCLPRAVDSEGRHVEVPADHGATPGDLPDLAFEVSAEPRPSPQARHCPASTSVEPTIPKLACKPERVDQPTDRDATPENLPEITPTDFESLDVSVEPETGPHAQQVPTGPTNDPSSLLKACEAEEHKAGKWVGSPCSKTSEGGQVEAASVPVCTRDLPEGPEAKVFTFRIPICGTAVLYQFRATATRVPAHPAASSK